MKITAGQHRDSPEFTAVLERFSARDSRGGPARCRPRGVGRPGVLLEGEPGLPAPLRDDAVIPQKTDQAAARKRKGSEGSRPSGHDAELHKARYTIERCVGRLKQRLGTATRTDKPSESHEAGPLPASV
ncbi:MAG TPA: hypothetical protein VGS97_27410 [Actinocrinis sp.]|uniref:hypothetical protein n=1 Tax=Actinocrinis sp. TaxID=1920516 RepID=UPI002DDCA101|nr:hypothetical protein [Actinocrinis sp.]HEV2347847.1 hypothetical protein [Actinocrinis sp.]